MPASNCPNCGRFMRRDTASAFSKQGKTYRKYKCHECGGEEFVVEVKKA